MHPAIQNNCGNLFVNYRDPEINTVHWKQGVCKLFKAEVRLYPQANRFDLNRRI